MRLVERVELAEHLAGHEPEEATDLGARDAGADGLDDRAGRPLLLGDLLEHRGEQLGEALDVGLDPGGPVDHEDRRGQPSGVQPGELADVRRGPLGALAELGDDGLGLLGADLGTRARQP